MTNPFELIKAFYTSDWHKVSDRDKARNFFMVNRLCGIAYPLQANSFNHLKIQPEKVVDFWKLFVTHHNKKSPQWLWTKTQKPVQTKGDFKYKEEVIDFIKSKYEISNREISEIMDFFPERFKIFYKEIESLLG